MKKFKILFLCALVAGFTSCEDAYDIVQDGEFNQAAAFRTVADMQLHLNEVYDRADNINEVAITAYMTDEIGMGNQNAGQNRDVYAFGLNNQDTFADAIWLNHYNLILQANRLLRGSALVTPAASEVATYNSIIAQARALRAWGHFQLLTYFSTDLKNDNALGVILMDRVPLPLETLPRSTNGAVFALIEADLQYAYDNVVPNATAAWKYVTKGFVNAFRARMYAYRGNYTLAAQYANDVIANAGVTLTPATPFVNSAAFYAAASTNPYRRMWADAAQGEMIFSLSREIGKTTIASAFYFNRTNLTGGPYHDMSRALFNLLDSDPDNSLAAGMPNDIRLYAFIDPTSRVDQMTPLVGISSPSGSPTPIPTAPYYQGETDPNYQTNDVLCIDKYPGKAGFDLGNDLKIFRLSEMYFIRAEAAVAAGNLPAAAADIQAVRNARTHTGTQPLPTYGSATAAWADILLERRRELCFEGHRLIDLKRLGALAGGVSIERYVKDCFFSPTCTIPTTDYRFTLPIPAGEINANPQIQQNPGY